MQENPSHYPSSDETTRMGLGTKNRQQQTAELCPQHLWAHYHPKLTLLNEFIEVFQGAGKDRDFIRWSQLTDSRGVPAGMRQRLAECFERWLSP